VSAADSDLDEGLDAGLETYPRTELVLLVLAPWIVGAGPAFWVLAIVPALWFVAALVQVASMTGPAPGDPT
jgi:hypothetical protein